ncbi:MAG: NAD(P)/FAD-dependent oxidoreductase [Synergistaceae bacterium]|jgi:predicted Rossmann fold flavoprotein|nr:NAD(P)/FAD-dependent oxidoreductase [Synergistaceae bacterium]
MERFDVIVIGGGPAGLMAAGRAAERGARVLLVEKNASLGEKLLLAGKRRCNITNAEPDMDAFLSRYGENGRFLIPGFDAFGPRETVAFFNRNGVRTVVERGNRVFPERSPTASGGGERVLDCLLLYCKKGRVRILRNSPVRALRFKNSRVERIVTAVEELFADRCILATGGKSYPKTGSEGDGYRFAALAGHTIVEPVPAIVPVRTRETWVKLARNFNLRNVKLTATVNGEKVDERFGEMEFTNFGVSGPIVMDLSSSVSDWMKRGTVQLILDLKPALSVEKLEARVERDFEKYEDREFGRALVDLLPASLIPMILELSDVPADKGVKWVSPEERRDLVGLLKNVVLTVNGLWSFNHAVVTKGGVRLDEVDPATLRSRLCENLYFAGEILDLNGPTGGFNLQVCWTTGFVAGSSTGGFSVVHSSTLIE